MANLDCNAAAAARPPCQEDQLFYFTVLLRGVKRALYHEGTETRRKSFLSFMRLPLVLCRNPWPEARFTPASRSSKSRLSAPSIRGNLFLRPRRTFEMPPHRRRGLCPPHQCGSW